MLTLAGELKQVRMSFSDSFFKVCAKAIRKRQQVGDLFGTRHVLN